MNYDLKELKEKYIGKYCTTKSKKQIFKILDLKLENKTLTVLDIYAEVQVIFGYNLSPHYRLFRHLIILENKLEYHILSIKNYLNKI